MLSPSLRMVWVVMAARKLFTEGMIRVMIFMSPALSPLSLSAIRRMILATVFPLLLKMRTRTSSSVTVGNSQFL